MIAVILVKNDKNLRLVNDFIPARMADMNFDVLLNYLPDFDVLAKDALRLWQHLDSKSISTVVLIMAAVLTRSIIVAWLEKNTDMPPHVVIQWRQRLYRATLLLIVILVMVIWAPELRTFAVTLVAVAAAIVVALKEVITCFTGGIIRATVEGAHIGGRIVIGDVHGDVAATDLMSTTILEVNDYGQRTGRTIVLPNSFFINTATITETADDRKYVLMMVGVPLRRTDNWPHAEKILLEIGQEITEPYLKEAKKHFARFNRRFGFNAPGPEPKILLDWDDPEKITLNLRVAVPVTEQNAKRQEILRKVLQEMHEISVTVKNIPLDA